jgi:uncharacterized membrane protein
VAGGFVGLALLALTLWAFFWVKSQDASDEFARAVAVNALVIGQVFYLLNSRYKLDSSSLSLKAHLGNKYLAMVIAAVSVLQLRFTMHRSSRHCSKPQRSRSGFGRGYS